jgi:putative transposase
MHKQSMVHSMREVVTGGRTAGGKRRARSATTAARSKSSGQGFAALTGRSSLYRVAEDWLGKWAMKEMLINVATRKFARSVRLPEGDVPGPAGAGLSKSAASRRSIALSAVRMKDWMVSDLSGLDLLVIQIDGIHMDKDLTWLQRSVLTRRATTIRSALPSERPKTPRPTSR